MNKHTMKAKFIVLDSISGDDRDDMNVLAFVTFNNFVDSLTTTLDDQKVTIVDDEDEQDKLLNS